MLTKLLKSKFIKIDPNMNRYLYNKLNREKYGYLSGFVGIVINLTICLLEFFIGFITNSIAITADAFHNLTDVAASIITIIGFNLSNKPADEEHPFGHGRIEYLSAVMVSFIILLIGLVVE
ncbi:MAG TPA: cation diffusion facilitator family transporter [Clostridiaceae bacterium]